MSAPVCQLCRVPLDIESDATVLAEIYRLAPEASWERRDPDEASGDLQVLHACSQEHLGEYLSRFPLPPAIAPDDVDSLGIAEGIGCALAIVLALALMVGAAFGFYSLVDALL